MAAAFGVPNLSNVFYYGKDFSSFEEETDEEGKLKKKKYKPLSSYASFDLFRGERAKPVKIVDKHSNRERSNDSTE